MVCGDQNDENKACHYWQIRPVGDEMNAYAGEHTANHPRNSWAQPEWVSHWALVLQSDHPIGRSEVSHDASLCGRSRHGLPSIHITSCMLKR